MLNSSVCDANHKGYYTAVCNIAGVSAQSFVQAFSLAQTAFNVQLASPQVYSLDDFI